MQADRCVCVCMFVCTFYILTDIFNSYTVREIRMNHFTLTCLVEPECASV